MIYYFIRVYDDHVDSFREYDINTDKGAEMARVFAFLMDGGAGNEYEDDGGIQALAFEHTEIVSRTL